MNKIREDLWKLQDQKYRDLQIRILPNLKPNTIIGVRTPELRKYAKKLLKDEYNSFLEELPHTYFDENQLHAFLISEIKDYNTCITYINKFLPYIDNWATCDQLSPKVFKNHKKELLEQIKKWISSKQSYTIRFGIGMLMKYYLEENFEGNYLKWVSKIKSEEYYVNMMIAWFFATALAKQYKATLPYIEKQKLDTWTHNKTIQKAIESYRITKDQKDHLKKLRKS